jgi:Domain of unknown function (DUF1840)
MLYKFKSKAAGDVIMLGPNGDAVMRLLGREPSAKGIFDVQDLPALMAALEKAVADDEASRREAQSDESHDQPAAGDGVGLRQRVWPLVEMMRRSLAHQEPIVWGV